MQLLNKVQDLKERSYSKQPPEWWMTSGQGCSCSQGAFRFLILKKMEIVMPPNQCHDLIWARGEMFSKLLFCPLVGSFVPTSWVLHSKCSLRCCYVPGAGLNFGDTALYRLPYGGRMDLQTVEEQILPLPLTPWATMTECIMSEINHHPFVSLLWGTMRIKQSWETGS
jgi:hypothetical protein